VSGIAVAVTAAQGHSDHAPRRLPTDPQWWAGALLSFAILIAVAAQLGGARLVQVARDAPVDPFFWSVFAAFYLLPSACDWIVFRRLWRLPVAGLAALMRKQVANELVFGYSGEAQFYLWARRHAKLATSPFGAVKDVAVLSAVAGNVVTLGLMIASSGLLARVVVGSLGQAFAISAGLIAASSLAMFLLRRRLFSLPTSELWAIFITHVLRIVGSMLLLGVLWHLLLPALPATGLLVLVTMRMMLSRLPFLPAKDVVFAGLVAILLGRDAQVVPAMAMLGGLVIAAHVAVALCSAAAGLIRKVQG
jgi:hypothetical protein